MRINRGLEGSLFVYTLEKGMIGRGIELESVINKVITVVLWLMIGGMIGYAIGAYKMFTMIIK